MMACGICMLSQALKIAAQKSPTISALFNKDIRENYSKYSEEINHILHATQRNSCRVLHHFSAHLIHAFSTFFKTYSKRFWFYKPQYQLANDYEEL